MLSLFFIDCGFVVLFCLVKLICCSCIFLFTFSFHFDETGGETEAASAAAILSSNEAGCGSESISMLSIRDFISFISVFFKSIVSFIVETEL